MKSELGKIKSVTIGRGGYQDAMFGASFSLGGTGWGVCDFLGTWTTKVSDETKWTEADRIKVLGETMLKLISLCEDAKVSSVEKLVGVPIRVYFNGQALSHWEILKEVI